MRKIKIILICCACLFFLTSAAMAQKAKTTMTNADVIQMAAAGLSDQVIITSIRQAPARDFDLAPTGLIALKKGGVSDSVIQVMQEVTTSTKPSKSGDDKAASDDRAQAINELLRQQVISQSGGVLSLSSFAKTNGYEQEVTKLYVLEWQADILFEQEGYKPGNAIAGYWQDFVVLARQPSTLNSLVMGGSGIHFNRGAKVRLTGDSVLRKTEKGWRIEGFNVKTHQLLAEGSPGDPTPPGAASTVNNEAHDRLYGKNVAMSPGNLADLAKEIDDGKEITMPVRLNSGVGIVNMVNANVRLTKTSFTLTASCCWQSFTISPDKILELTKQLQPNQPEQVSRIHLKLAIKNRKGDKEDKKDFYLYNTAARGVGGEHQDAFISCSRCDNSLEILYALLMKIRSGQ